MEIDQVHDDSMREGADARVEQQGRGRGELGEVKRARARALSCKTESLIFSCNNSLITATELFPKLFVIGIFTKTDGPKLESIFACLIISL